MKIYTLCVRWMEGHKNIISSSKKEVVDEVERLIMRDIENLREKLCNEHRNRFFNDEDNVENFKNTSYETMEDFMKYKIFSPVYLYQFCDNDEDDDDIGYLRYFSNKYPEYKYLKLIDDEYIHFINIDMADMYIEEKHIIDTIEELDKTL